MRSIGQRLAPRGRTESEDCNSSTATTPMRSGYGEKRRLRYHKVNGKKVQNPDGKYAASWEERYHKKRHFHHFSSRTTTTTRRPRERNASETCLETA